MMTISCFIIRPVHPVHDVQSAVRPHEEDVISRQILHLAVALQHNELGQDRHRFEVNAEHPQQLLEIPEEVESLSLPADEVRERGQHQTGEDGELDVTEGVLSLVVRGADRLLGADGVHDAGRAGDVQKLHHGVVEAVVGREEVGVPRHEDEEEELVRAEGDARGVFGHAQAEEEDDDGEDVGHVPAEAEDVHGHFLIVFFCDAGGCDFFEGGLC